MEYKYIIGQQKWWKHLNEIGIPNNVYLPPQNVNPSAAAYSLSLLMMRVCSVFGLLGGKYHIH